MTLSLVGAMFLVPCASACGTAEPAGIIATIVLHKDKSLFPSAHSSISSRPLYTVDIKYTSSARKA